MSDERMPPLTDAEKVRLALEYGSEHTPALTREPVFVWTNAEAALDRLESQNQALQEALRNIADICHGWAGPEAAASNAMRLASVAAFARSVLSPTQETDPE